MAAASSQSGVGGSDTVELWKATEGGFADDEAVLVHVAHHIERVVGLFDLTQKGAVVPGIWN